MDVDVHLPCDGILGGRWTYLEHASLFYDGSRASPHGGHDDFRRLVDGSALGKTHVGNVVGVGRALDVGTCAVVPLRWVYRASVID